MKDAELVGRICYEMRKQAQIPVTVKCRLGVDKHDSYEFVCQFIETVSKMSGVTKFIIHARKCLLDGLSPHENRTVPELKYDWVIKLKQDFPHLKFVINGGFKSIESIKDILAPENNLEGCMIGRMAYLDPWTLASVDKEIWGKDSPDLNRTEIIRTY